MCLTNTDVKIDTAYSFLDTIKDRFFKKYSIDQTTKAIPYGINFTDELKNTMDHFNTNPEPDKAKDVIAELIEVKNITIGSLGI